MQTFVFPNWVNRFTVVSIVGGLAVAGYLATCLFGAIHPEIINVGHQPKQPVPFSHRIHAGQLKLDCRYCHNTVEKAAHAAVPPTQTCMNCHTQIHRESPNLAKVRESYETGMPIEWIKVHTLGDYAYFNHAAHVNRGVGCVECHGRVDQMEEVYRVAPLSMGWCLECHRQPVDRLRPAAQVTNLAWDQKKELTREQREQLQKTFNIHPSENCSTCHR